MWVKVRQWFPRSPPIGDAVGTPSFDTKRTKGI